MRARVIPAAAVAAAVAIVTAGCAGAHGAIGSPDGAAALLPADTLIFVAVDTTAKQAQLTALRDSLLGRANLSWTGDLEPALGDELDVALLPGAKRAGVALTQPRDAAKLRALAAKHHLAVREVGGWTALAATAATLDLLGHAPTLAADTSFVSAMSRLDAKAVVRAYASANEAQQLLGQLPGQSRILVTHQGATGITASTRFIWAAADAVLDGHVTRVHGYARTVLPPIGRSRPLQEPALAYESALVDEIPADALLVVDTSVVPGQYELVDPSQVPKSLRPLVTSSVPSQLDDLLGGETALYVRAGLPMPEVTVVTQPTDTTGAVQAIEPLLTSLRGFVKQLPQVTLYHAVVGGQLVVSTSLRGIAVFRSGGPKLASDPDFQHAQSLAGMPAATTGFVYANLKSAAPFLQLAGAKDAKDLAGLHSFLAYTERTSTDVTLTAVLDTGSS